MVHLAADKFGSLFALVERWTYLQGVIPEDGDELVSIKGLYLN